MTVAAVACGPAPASISDGGSAYEPDVAPLGDTVAVVWHGGAGEESEIHLRLVDAEGTPVEPVRQLTDDVAAAYEPSVAAIDRNGVAVAWYTKAADGATAAYIGAWSTDGSRRWVQRLSDLPARNPVVRASRLAIFAAWIQRDSDGSENIWRRWWTREGEPIGLPTFLAPASATTWNLNAAADDGGSAWVVFDAETSTRASEVFIARDDVSGRPLQRLTSDDGRPSKYPDIAVRAGRAAIAWYDEREGNSEVYLMIEALDRMNDEISGRALRVTSTEDESIGAYVAWNGERVGLAWSDKTGGEGGQHEIYFQEFDAGRARSASRRLTENGTASLVPAIRPWRDGFVLAWNEFTAASAGAPASSDVAVYLAPGQ